MFFLDLFRNRGLYRPKCAFSFLDFLLDATKLKTLSPKELKSLMKLSYEELDYDEVFLSQRRAQDSVSTWIETEIISSEIIPMLEKYYNYQFESYEIIPSLTLFSGPAWGLTVEDRALFILGPLDSENGYIYPGSDLVLLNLAVHEWGHSFANSKIERIGLDFFDATRASFEPLRVYMEPQGYYSWESCVIEHVIRATEVILGTVEMDYYVKEKQFVYLPYFVNQLRVSGTFDENLERAFKEFDSMK